jgi:hypothetical protein
MTKKYSWNYKIAPLNCDMKEYIDWSFYDFEYTKIRSDILIFIMQQAEIKLKLELQIIGLNKLNKALKKQDKIFKKLNKATNKIEKKLLSNFPKDCVLGIDWAKDYKGEK